MPMAAKGRKHRATSGVDRGSAARDRLVGRLRQICMALPEAKEKLSHGEPTWFAGKGKVFAMLDDHHHGAPHVSVWLPQPFGAVAALVCEAYLSVATTKLRNLALAAAGSAKPRS